MNFVWATLKDRRRSQKGSVLSGVLIMTAFIAIIAGALMTELSTNFLLSRDLLARSANEATMDSAMELAMNQMQTNPIWRGCPDLSTTQAALNGRTAVVNFTSCWPSYREKTYNPIASGGGSFTVAGSHSVIPTASPPQDLYVVGDGAGNVYQFPYGQSSPNWSYQVPGAVTAPPVTVQDVATGQTATDLMTLVPFSVTGSPPAGCGAIGCVAMLAEDTDRIPKGPDVFCYMAASDQVVAPVAMGANYPTVGFFGDLKGAVFAYAISEKTTPCPLQAKTSGTGRPVVAGPFVFPGPASGVATDEVYVVTSSSVLRYAYTDPPNVPASLTLASTLNLPQSGVAGVALERNTLPARLAISFSDGHVAMVQLSSQSNFKMTLLANVALGSPLQAAPTWCHCQPVDQIAIGRLDGALYLLDTSLLLIAKLPAGGPAIVSAPATDSVGEWFSGAADGYVSEFQQQGGNLVQVNQFGPVNGPISSALQLAPCSGNLCMYVAAQSGSAYRVPLDARDAVISACISGSTGACSGANPRLWSTVEVGREGFPNEVHVLGWTYHSA